MNKLILIALLCVNIWAKESYSNALVDESSPYLQQHKHNPVNWYPWGKEALDKAKREGKLIFLSIGYSTCHWCHVMEDESFESKDIAKLLNDNYISIKVDREEYPQIDKKYQNWYMSVHGKRGGWPLSVFMSPDAKAFHLASYIPAEEGYGSKGMKKLLPSFVEMYKNKIDFNLTLKSYEKLRVDGLSQKSLKSKLNEELVLAYMKRVKEQYDSKNGGFSKRPKFPEASKLSLLLDIYRLYNNTEALNMLEQTLEKMAKGGIYDQVGGGFFRYTTDEQWHIPHFEKMLYSNAELVVIYAKLYNITKKPLYKKVVVETIAQMEQNYMQDGLFFSASNADSSGVEGGYFIFSYEEVKEGLLAKGMKLKDVENALAYLGVEEDGNIDSEFSNPHITSKSSPKEVAKVKAYLKELSSKREFPFVDKKVITSWNAMMIKALFVASKIDSSYISLATSHLEKLLRTMYKGTVLYHQTLVTEEPKQEALLEDYAFLIDALIEAYGVTYNKDYLANIVELTHKALKLFYRDDKWYLSSDGVEVEADYDDKYYTASLSLMLENLVQVASLSEDLKLNYIVKKTLQNKGAVLGTKPESASKLLHTFLRLKKGDIIIKSTLNKLLESKEIIDSINYPFILTKVEESNEYLACIVNSCFDYDKNMSKLKEKIEKSLE